MAYDVTITPLTPTPYALIDLRGDAEVRRSFSRVINIELPEQPNTTAIDGETAVLNLGPDQWLVKTADAAEQHLQQTLNDAVQGQFAAVTVVSDHYTGFRIDGPDAREILAQASSIDLHPSQFGPGQCARCKFARTQAILLPLNNTPGYEVFVESTYAHYLRLWFDQAIGA